jgi:hypothetical protein
MQLLQVADLDMSKIGKNSAEDTIPADLHLGKTGENVIDDMISATPCTKINAALPLQYDDAFNLLLSDTILVMYKGESTTGEKHHKSKSSNTTPLHQF